MQGSRYLVLCLQWCEGLLMVMTLTHCLFSGSSEDSAKRHSSRLLESSQMGIRKTSSWSLHENMLGALQDQMQPSAGWTGLPQPRFVRPLPTLWWGVSVHSLLWHDRVSWVDFLNPLGAGQGWDSGSLQALEAYYLWEGEHLLAKLLLSKQSQEWSPLPDDHLSSPSCDAFLSWPLNVLPAGFLCFTSLPRGLTLHWCSSDHSWKFIYFSSFQKSLTSKLWV